MGAPLEPVEGVLSPVTRYNLNFFGSQASSRGAWLLVVPMLLIYAVAFIVPLVMILVESVSSSPAGTSSWSFSLGNYLSLLTDGVTLDVILQTFVLSLIITVVCAVIAYPVALQMRRSVNSMRMILLAMVIGPLLTSVIVRNVAWLLILGRNGIINSTLMKVGLIDAPLPLMYNNFGVIVAVAHVYLAFMVLPIYGALTQIDSRVEESAASLGATPFSVFWRITFPLSWPGLIAGTSLVFILSMGLYLTPTIMGGSFVVTASTLITDLARNQYNWPMASALAMLLLIAIGVSLAVFQLVARATVKHDA